MTASSPWSGYDASRAPGTDVSVLCHAPFVSLNFDQSGTVTACCYNREYVLGRYPDQNLTDIWTGPAARSMREAFLTGAYVPGCDRCFDQLRSRNFSGALMRNFDRFSIGLPPRRDGARVGLPLALEFELSNTCSLECVMCGGHWSSAIRAKREKLPPLPNPYDDRFVEQLDALLPSATMLRFLGGEPFLITTYHKIWDRLRRLNPNAEVSITTSGATVPARPRQLIEDLRAHIVISLDAITKDTYESIRLNARFETAMASIEDFRDYTSRKGTTLTVACCPMTHNWQELGTIVDFCETRGIGVFFNTVTFPLDSSLAGLPARDLELVIGQLRADAAARSQAWRQSARDQWEGLVNQLTRWLEDKHDVLHTIDTRTTAIVAAADAAMPGARPRVDLVDAMSRAYQVQLERGDGPETTDLLRRLPPLAVPDAAGTATAFEVIVAAHVFWRFSGASGTSAPLQTVRDEHQQFLRFLTLAADRPETLVHIEQIGDALRRKVADGDIGSICEIVSSVGSWLDRSVTPYTRLRAAVDAEAGTDEMRLRLGQYITDLLVTRGVADVLGIETDVAATPVRPDRGRVTVKDLPAALRAIELFHSACQPASRQQVLASRTSMIRAAAANGLTDAARQAIEEVPIAAMYAFLADASDEEFSAAAEHFLQP
jgi:MoaA/NifB/PqqE/SkfB family radical SAM enzyme